MTTTFSSFGLRPDLVAGVTALGFTQPTPVQAHAIPLVLQGRDAIVQARTGSGKTLAFGLPLLSKLRRGKAPQALVVVPTRELAIQVADAMAQVAPGSPIRVMSIYGGVGLGPQEAALRRGVDLVVGTPGRLKDLLGRGSLDLTQVHALVLDEADEMLDMGFRRDIEFLLDRLPGRKQTLIFSATMPEAIEAIARRHLTDPAIVKLVADGATPSEIEHYFLRMGVDERLERLIGILRGEDPTRALIFTRMKHETKRLAEKLYKQAGIEAGYLNGNMSQNARNAMMQRFRDGEIRFLVATDVAARGIDVEGLSHVIHYAVPTVVETYVHRSGRTGRAGASGMTITFVTPDAEDDFKAIRKRVDVRPFPTLGPTPAEPAPVLDGGAAASRRFGVPAAPPAHRKGPRSAGSAAKLQEGAAAGNRRDRSPATPAPEAQAPGWRRFRMALPSNHRHSAESYHRWLTRHVGVDGTAVRAVAVHAEHATFEVAPPAIDALLTKLKLKQR